MFNVFISYPGEPIKWKNFAKELKDELNNHPYINALISPISDGKTKDISLEVRDLIKSSLYFILIYPEICKENSFVNQELGYAYKLYENNELDLIILWENRENIRGLITRDTVKLPNTNRLTLQNSSNQSTPDKIELFETIKNTILGGKMYPIYVREPEIQNERFNDNRIDYEIEFTIDVIPNKSLKDCVMEFVGPKPFNIDYKSDQILPVKEVGIFNHIHSSFEEFFQEKEITRRTFYLGELQGLRSYKLLFHSYEKSTQINVLYFGFCFITDFGPKLYKIKITQTEELKLEINMNELSQNTREKIPIERNCSK